jgi:hypothetical protein
VDTDFGPVSGTNLDVNVNSGTASFNGFQNLKRIQLANGTTAQPAGSGAVVNVRDLAVVGGTANVNVGSGQFFTQIASGTFSIPAGGTLNKKGVGAMAVSGSQNHGANSNLQLQNGTLTIATDCGSPATRNLAIDADQGTLNFNSSQHLRALSTNFGAINVGTNGGGVLVTNAFAVSGEAGGLNLNDNDMILDYTGGSQLEAMRVLLKNGYANGNWNGIGIASDTAAAHPDHATALGFAEASTILGAGGGTFSGQSVDGSAVLVKYTFYGDANLSGNVDTIDFNIVASNFNNTSKVWSDGDFDFQQDIDTVDFNLLAANFSRTGLGPAAASAPPAARSGGTTIAEIEQPELWI